MLVVGIDPGYEGALVIISYRRGAQPKIIGCLDVPTIGEKSATRVNARLVVTFLRSAKIEAAFIERAQAMPDQGASSGFNYGRCTGALETCVMGCNIPLFFIESRAWKKTFSLLKTGKEQSRMAAITQFPGTDWFNRKLDHNRAEAALIALHGAKRESGG